MAPEIPTVTSKTPLLSRISPKSHFNQILHQRSRGGAKMKLTKRKLIPVLVFILCGASVFRFFNISMISNLSSSRRPPAALPSIHQHVCSTASSVCGKNTSHLQALSPDWLMSKNESSLTEKEARFLLEFLSTATPCNLLIFGNDHQYSDIAYVNAGGVTIILEENNENTSMIMPVNSARVFKIMYNTIASEAYQMLKIARENLDCSPKRYLTKVAKCNLGLSNLPQEVYDIMWDVVVVDGPRGDAPNSPGRMTSIYTASMLARRGNMTHVIVHNVDRMIEKWFSWEFLCEENLVSSKGRFQHFHIQGATNATTFCTS